jgi:two-component system phosphate regulon sensor histidine kinase PhoR
LYASLVHGGSREDNRRVLARLEETGAFTRVWVVKGDSMVRQFGAGPDELPQDELDRRALAGEEVGEIRREEGYRVVRHVTPFRLQAECQRCHQAQVGVVAGAISAEISLREVETALRRRRDVLLLVLGGGLLALGLLTFYALQRLVIRPLQAIQRGTAAIAQGNLGYRLRVRTGDELEALATEFNRMAQRLQESYTRVAEEQSKILAAIEASQDAIWVSDAGRRMVMVNSALERLIGRRREELLGRICYDIVGLHDHDGASICSDACPYLHSTDASGRVEGYISTASRKEVWVEISYGCVTDPDGHLAGTVHIVRDLTQRKEIERLKDEFISTVSHELRTPLNHIKGFATTLLQTDVVWDAATQRDFLGSINREADRLANLVEKILHLSSLEAGGLPMEKEWYQVNDLIDGALQRRRSLTADRPVDLCLSPDLPVLFVDGREIEVVLINLIENAVKYSHPGTLITLSAEHQGQQVVFSVADQGIGIPAEHLERIFERFYRVNDVGGVGHRAPGTGLGLAICRRIVEAHSGRIWVESTPGVGSRFYFSLPLDTTDGLTSSPAFS